MRRWPPITEADISDNGCQAVVLTVNLSDLDAAQLQPDYPGLEEPITTVVGMSESDINREWAEADGGGKRALT